MNLLDKNKSFGALVLGLFLFISCEENGSFGLNGDDVAPVEFSSTDISVTSSVVLLDSIRSSSAGTLLVGNFQNTTFGSVEGTGYNRLNLNRQSLFQVASQAVLDSVRLNLTFNYQYDTSAMSTNWGLEMFSLGRPVTDTVHITTDNIVVSATLLASGEINVTKLDSLYSIDVDETWGNEIFELLRLEDPVVLTQEAFEAFFRGVAFKALPGVTPNVLGIEVSENSNITFYYREPSASGEIDRALAHVLSFHTVPNFYGLEIDRTGTPTAMIDQFGVEIEPASGKRYVQSGAGIVTKIDISALNDFIQEEPRIVNLAEISVGPIDVLNDNLPPPPFLNLIITDEQNTRIKDQGRFRTVQSDGNNQIGSANPVLLTYDAETRTYKGSITSFIQTYFAGQFRRNELMLYPSSMTTGVNGASFDPEDIKIKIIFSELL